MIILTCPSCKEKHLTKIGDNEIYCEVCDQIFDFDQDFLYVDLEERKH